MGRGGDKKKLELDSAIDQNANDVYHEKLSPFLSKSYYRNDTNTHDSVLLWLCHVC